MLLSLATESGKSVPVVASVTLTASAPAAERDTGHRLTAIYDSEYRSLVRLAAVLTGDASVAEDVVQDCFVAMHGAFGRLRDGNKASGYLRRSVVNRARSVLRHRMVVDRNPPAPMPDEPSAEHGAITQLERSEVVAALRTLPARQREAVVLRYYLDLPEREVARSMRISQGAVKSHMARAMASLRNALAHPA